MLLRRVLLLTVGDTTPGAVLLLAAGKEEAGALARWALLLAIGEFLGDGSWTVGGGGRSAIFKPDVVCLRPPPADTGALGEVPDLRKPRLAFPAPALAGAVPARRKAGRLGDKFRGVSGSLVGSRITGLDTCAAVAVTLDLCLVCWSNSSFEQL